MRRLETFVVWLLLTLPMILISWVTWDILVAFIGSFIKDSNMSHNQNIVYKRGGINNNLSKRKIYQTILRRDFHLLWKSLALFITKMTLLGYRFIYIFIYLWLNKHNIDPLNIKGFLKIIKERKQGKLQRRRKKSNFQWTTEWYPLNTRNIVQHWKIIRNIRHLKDWNKPPPYQPWSTPIVIEKDYRNSNPITHAPATRKVHKKKNIGE